MLPRIRTLLLLPAMVCMMAADWETFTSPNGKYTVAFPGKPTETDQKTADGLLMKIWHFEDKDAAYLVVTATMPVPDNLSEETIDKFLDATDKPNKERLTTRKVKLDGKYPGREQLEINENKWYVRTRMFPVDKVLYQVMVTAPKKDLVTSKDADKFLDSFQLKK